MTAPTGTVARSDPQLTAELPSLGPLAAAPRAVAALRRRPGSVTRAVVLLGLFGVLLAATEFAVIAHVDAPYSWVMEMYPEAALVFVLGGVLAWLRRPSNRTGQLLLLGAAATLISGAQNLPAPALVAAGTIGATLPLALVLHLLHAFPSGRLRGRVSIWCVRGVYFAALVLQAPQYLFGGGLEGPATVLQIDYRPDLADAGLWVQNAVGCGVYAVTAVVLVGRSRAASASGRRVLLALYLYGLVAASLFAVPVSLVPADVLTIAVVQLSLLLGVPIAFVAALLLGGFARAGELQELAVWFGEREDARAGLREALARALGDATLELAFWVPASGVYVDAEGRELRRPRAGSDRGLVEVELAGRLIGAIVYDAELIADPAEVRAAGQLAAVALDRERLNAELWASRERLRRSRARVVQAADDERRRIARDLHDGLQARLVLLAMRADAVRGEPDLPAGERAALDGLHAEVQVSITQLRELVHGVMPAVLTERGLFAAVAELASGVPLVAELELDRGGPRLPPAVESAGYFVVAEAISNALKHAHADRLVIRAGVLADRLRVEVSDDGVGGARIDGTGLRGIADRVEALDGTLTVDSPNDGGTRVVAELLCAS